MPLHSAATIAAMSRDEKIDYQGAAVAAMKMAVATTGFERINWVRLAQAWHDLGRDRVGRAVAGTATSLEERGRTL